MRHFGRSEWSDVIVVVARADLAVFAVARGRALVMSCLRTRASILQITVPWLMLSVRAMVFVLGQHSPFLPAQETR